MLFTVKVFNTPYLFTVSEEQCVDFEDLTALRAMEIMQMCMNNGKAFQVECSEADEPEGPPAAASCGPEACDVR